jgi:hypothetical protein
MKIISTFLFILIFCIGTQYCHAQNTGSSQSVFLFHSTKEKKARIVTDRKNTVSATLGYFDPWIGVTYERLMFSRWGIDVSAGVIGASIGTKLYFPKLAEGKISFLVGISEGLLLLVGTKHYIPAGLSFLGRNGFRCSLDAGPQIYHDSNDGIDFGLSLRIGKSF